MKTQSDYQGFEAFSNVAFPEHKLKVDPYLSRLYRPFSLRLSWALLRLGVTPNFITYMQILIGLLGCYIIYAKHDLLGFVVGVLLLHVAYVLDCVDGEIARATKTESLQGVFLDKFAHAITMPAIFLAVGTHIAASHTASGQGLIILSWLASFATFNPVSRLVLTVVDALQRKGDVAQYKIETYQNPQPSGAAVRQSLIARTIQSIGRPDNATGVFWLALHLFRHVSYLAGISILLLLQALGGSFVIVVLWLLACSALVLKEAAMLVLVINTSFIEKRLREVMPGPPD